MVMTSNSSPGVDTRWGYPQGGYITVGPVPPGMGGTPLKPAQPGLPLKPGQPGQQMPGAPMLPGASMQQGSGSGAVTTGFGLKNSPFGQFGGFHPNTVGVMRKNFGL